MSEFKQYRKSQLSEMRPWEGEDLGPTGELRASGVFVSIQVEDLKAGSPKPGDMIARNPRNHADQWLVAAKFFADNYVEAT